MYKTNTIQCLGNSKLRTLPTGQHSFMKKKKKNRELIEKSKNCSNGIFQREQGVGWQPLSLSSC